MSLSGAGTTLICHRDDSPDLRVCSSSDWSWTCSSVKLSIYACQQICYLGPIRESGILITVGMLRKTPLGSRPVPLSLPFCILFGYRCIRLAVSKCVFLADWLDVSRSIFPSPLSPYPCSAPPVLFMSRLLSVNRVARASQSAGVHQKGPWQNIVSVRALKA